MPEEEGLDSSRVVVNGNVIMDSVRLAGEILCVTVWVNRDVNVGITDEDLDGAFDRVFFAVTVPVRTFAEIVAV